MPMSHSLAGRIALGTGGASGLGRAAAEALDKEREKAVKDAADDLKRMTMTVIDGDFPREVVGAQNLIFGEYRMPARRNSSEFYDAKDKKPAGKREGTLKLGAVDPPARRGAALKPGLIMLGGLFGVAIVAHLRRQRRRAT